MPSVPPDKPRQPPQYPSADRQPPPAPSPAQPVKTGKHIWYGLGGLAIGLLLGTGTVGGIVGGSALVDNREAAAQQEAVAESFSACSLDSVDGAYLADDGLSIELSGVSLWSGPDWSDMTCVGDRLGMPDSAELRMQQTRALDGTQHADWGPYSVSWTYHPDDGLSTVFEYTGDELAQAGTQMSRSS